MELHAVEASRLVGHAGDGAAGGGSDQLESGRHGGDLVAVAHPDVEQAVPFGVAMVLDAVEEPAVAARPHLRVAELAVVGVFHFAAELLRHGLHAVADAQHRHAELEHDGRRLDRALVIGGGVAAGEDDPDGAIAADEVGVDVARMDLAVDPRFTHPARDQLGDLGTEIEDEDLLMVHCWSPAFRWTLVPAVAGTARQSMW
jgi:hypothetical protein